MIIYRNRRKEGRVDDTRDGEAAPLLVEGIPAQLSAVLCAQAESSEQGGGSYAAGGCGAQQLLRHA